MRKYTIKLNDDYVYDVCYNGFKTAYEPKWLTYQQLERIMVYATFNDDSGLFGGTLMIEGAITPDMIKCKHCNGRGYTEILTDGGE